jgi:hypothetical protein
MRCVSKESSYSHRSTVERVCHSRPTGAQREGNTEQKFDRHSRIVLLGSGNIWLIGTNTLCHGLLTDVSLLAESLGQSREGDASFDEFPLRVGKPEEFLDISLDKPAAASLSLVCASILLFPFIALEIPWTTFTARPFAAFRCRRRHLAKTSSARIAAMDTTALIGLPLLESVFHLVCSKLFLLQSAKDQYFFVAGR